MDNKAIVRRFNKEFIQEGNMDSFNELISPDFINRTAPPGAPVGPEGVVYFFNHLLKPSFTNFTVQIHDTFRAHRSAGRDRKSVV